VRERPPSLIVVVPALVRRAVSLTSRPALIARGALSVTPGQVGWACTVEKSKARPIRAAEETKLFMLCVCGGRVGGWGVGEKEDTDGSLGEGGRGENDQ